MPDRVDTKRLRELHGRASAAPWVAERDGSIYGGDVPDELCGVEGHLVSWWYGDEDQQLAVEARNALPALLDAYDRCAAAERARDQIDELHKEALRAFVRLRDGVRRISDFAAFHRAGHEITRQLDALLREESGDG